MTTGAIIMMVLGLGITWGGAALCIRKAMKSESKESQINDDLNNEKEHFGALFLPIDKITSQKKTNT